MKAKKLSKREFARAIKLGLGRAVLHVRDYGDQGVEDVLRQAMFESNIFDQLFEGCRAWWIFDILCTTGHLKDYADYFQSTWDHASRKSLDRAHQTRLAGLFFEHGFEACSEIVLSNAVRLLRVNKELNLASEELIDVFDEYGFELTILEIAKLGVETSIDNYECNAIFEYAVEAFDEPSVKEVLDRCEVRNPTARKFREAVESFKDESEKQSAHRKELTLNEVLSLSEYDEKRDRVYANRRFGRTASDHEIKTIFEALIEAQDWKTQHALLNVFKDRDVPYIHSKLFLLLESEHSKVRRSCVKVLSRITDPMIRQKALAMMESSSDEQKEFALDLLERNYEPSDAPKVLETLKRIKNPDHLHWAGISVDTIADAAERTELRDCLLWLYENGPDSYCRRRFLEQLIEWGLCPEAVVHEARWDAAKGTNSIARKYYANRRLNRKESCVQSNTEEPLL